MPPSDTAARESTVVERVTATRESETPESGNKRTRPMRDIVGTLARFISFVNVDDTGGFAGACDGDLPRSTARSTVRNGAVNGASARSVRQHAVIRDNMDGCEAVEQAARHLRRAVGIVDVRVVISENIHVRRLSDGCRWPTFTSH